MRAFAAARGDRATRATATVTVTATAAGNVTATVEGDTPGGSSSKSSGRSPSGLRAGRGHAGLDRLSRWIAVAGGCGYSPIAPGTVGSLLGATLFWGATVLLAPVFFPELPSMGWSVGYASGLVGLFVVGCWAAGRAEHQFGQKDDGRIVIDEVVGQGIALAPLAVIAPRANVFELFGWVVTGFVLFRLFDVWKPGAIGWAERRFKGGFGVMADDAIAGFYSAAAIAVGIGVGLLLQAGGALA